MCLKLSSSAGLISLLQEKWLFLTILFSYLLGSLNFSIIFTKAISKQDIRNLGSKNAGFTNVLRSIGSLPAILTLLCDFSKGLVSVLIGKYIFSFFYLQNDISVSAKYGACISALFCVLGHIYPCFFKFKGGKGVATASAVVLLINWQVFVIVLLVFLVILFVWRMVSLASVCSALIYPISTFTCIFLQVKKIEAFFIADNEIKFIEFTISLIVSSVIIYKHKSNLYRILKGEESRISTR
ncbi:MAG: glycerol-3-phosphate 1-O-acyltransferase PlsY [Oscillospiraceae bacterium]|jgi:glycerol-3-phosphate acyltransferase PlsY|nr:glycerol-3-phosphate 1-O-acyltransferase PlsY [Oscillospiraceae bacterium]